MDEDERESNASSDNEQDEVMEDADAPEHDDDDNENDNDHDNDNDNDNDNEDDDNDGEGEPDDDQQAADGRVPKRMRKGSAGQEAGAPAAASGAPGQDVTSPKAQQAGAPDKAAAGSPQSPRPPWQRLIAPERIQARLYDIVPTMAAPQATSINAFAATPDMRFWMTGGSDGYVRKYDGVGTINGKQLLTVAQRHPFVDSVVKAGILMSYWENEEPPGVGSASGGAGASSGAGAASDHVLSPVYSLAVQSQGLWVLSGTEGGSINLSSARHDEGKRIAYLSQHSSAVSVLTMLPDEKSVLSGSWDKTIADWDLNVGEVRRRFESGGGQISAVELRPAGGSLIPQAAAYDEVLGVKAESGSRTISGNNDQPFRNGDSGGGDAGGPALNGGGAASSGAGGGGSAEGAGSGFAQSASPAHESLFGSPAGSLFGEDNMGGDGNGNVFGDDDDDFGEMDLNGGGGGGGGQNGSDVAMGDGDTDTPAGAGKNAAAASSSKGGDQGSDGAGSSGKNTGAANGNGNVDAAASQDDTATATSTDDKATTEAGHDAAAATAAPGTAEPASPTQGRRASQGGSMVVDSTASGHVDPTQSSDQVFVAASVDGTLRIWDRRVQHPVARIGLRPGLPPWCMGACWSPDGNWLYAGRRNGTVEEYSIHKARSGWLPERALKLPAGSGPVSCVRAMPNGRHLVVASHDILRLYDLRDSSAFKGSSVPFLIIPGPPRAGVISQLYIDPTSRFMVSTAGTRGWDGTSTETLVGYEINVSP